MSHAQHEVVLLLARGRLAFLLFHDHGRAVMRVDNAIADFEGHGSPGTPPTPKNIQDAKAFPTSQTRNGEISFFADSRA